MAALPTKHSVVPMFKKTYVSFRSFVKRKRSLLMVLAVIYLHDEVNMPCLPSLLTF